MGYDADNFFRWTPAWLVCGLLLIALLLAAEVGYRFATRRRANVPSGDDKGHLGIVLGALLGLLSLLLGFTYSNVIIRAESRKNAIIEEANAIGTAYLRAELVPAPIGPELESVLREYLDTRIVSDDVAHDPKRLQKAIQHSEQVQAKIWPIVQRVIQGRTPNPLDALLVASLNAVIDMDTVRLAAARDHVPVEAIWMLCLLSIVSLGLCGLISGLADRRSFKRNAAFAIVIVVVIFMILDMDQPRSGFIRVSQQSLKDLRQQLGSADADAHVNAGEVAH